jgi:hypothetical protein
MIYDIYGTVVNQLITGKPTAQAGLSMAKLHAVPSPSEPAARCRWHRWWGLCCCNQDLPGSTIKIGKGHQDLKSKCEYIYILLYTIYYYILYYIIYYTILYIYIYIIVHEKQPQWSLLIPVMAFSGAEAQSTWILEQRLWEAHFS